MPNLTPQQFFDVYTSKVAELAVELDHRRPNHDKHPRLIKENVRLGCPLELMLLEYASQVRGKYGCTYLQSYQQGGQGAVYKLGERLCAKVIPITERMVMQNCLHSGILEAGMVTWQAATGNRFQVPHYKEIWIATPELIKELLPVGEYEAWRKPRVPEMFAVFIMKFYKGGDLQQYVQKQQSEVNSDGHWPADMQFNSNCMRQLLQAIDQLHDHQVFHCDVKPSNVFLESEESRTSLVLGDITSCLLVSLDGTVDMTRASVTPGYMDPLHVCAVNRQGITRGDLPLTRHYDAVSLGYTLANLYFGTCIQRVLGIRRWQVMQGGDITQAMFMWSLVGRATSNDAYAMMSCKFDINGNPCDFDTYKKKWQMNPNLRHVCSSFGNDALYLIKVFYKYATTGPPEQRSSNMQQIHTVMAMTMQPETHQIKDLLHDLTLDFNSVECKWNVVHIPTYEPEPGDENTDDDDTPPPKAKHDVQAQTSFVGGPNPGAALPRRNISIKTNFPPGPITKDMHAASAAAIMQAVGLIVASAQNKAAATPCINKAAIGGQPIHDEVDASEQAGIKLSASHASDVLAAVQESQQVDYVAAELMDAQGVAQPHHILELLSDPLADVQCSKLATSGGAVSEDVIIPEQQVAVERIKSNAASSSVDNANTPLTTLSPQNSSIPAPVTDAYQFRARLNPPCGMPVSGDGLSNANKQQPNMFSSAFRTACSWVGRFRGTAAGVVEKPTPVCSATIPKRGLADLALRDDVTPYFIKAALAQQSAAEVLL